MIALLNIATAGDLCWASPPDHDAIQRGADVAKTCSPFHQRNGAGRPEDAMPRIAGQSAIYLASQLTLFADGTRNNGVMRMFARNLNEQTRQDVAAYYASQSPSAAPTSASLKDSWILARGKLLARVGDESKQLQACDNCHGPDGSGELYAIPYLAGQSGAYLSNALREFQRKDRSSPLMGPVAARLGDDDVIAVASYFESMAGDRDE